MPTRRWGFHIWIPQSQAPSSPAGAAQRVDTIDGTARTDTRMKCGTAQDAVSGGPNLTDWNLPKIPRMGTLSGIGHPLFPTRSSMTATIIKPRSGTGTGEPQQRLRAEETIHLFGVPFWKRGGEALPADIWKETGPIWPGLSGTI